MTFLVSTKHNKRKHGEIKGKRHSFLPHSQPKQRLILDEPSNHLDIDAVETLETVPNYTFARKTISPDEKERSRGEKTLSGRNVG